MATEDIFPVDKSWTLFLDRDGVINRRIVNDYVKHPDEFHLLPGVAEAVAKMSAVFGKIIVVTNQQGIGKGLYSHDDLSAVHKKMIDAVEQAGGRIDAIFYAAQLASENSPMRKPGIGMALSAKEKFPEIDFTRSIMVGDSASDMEFARAAGMKFVWCCTDVEPATDYMHFSSLAGFASYISGKLP